MAQPEKNLACNAEGLSSVGSLGLEDPLEEGMAMHSMDNSMDRGAWQATISKSQTILVTEHAHTA